MRRKGHKNRNRYRQASPARPPRLRVMPAVALLAIVAGAAGLYYAKPWQWQVGAQLGHYPFRQIKVASTFRHLDAAAIRRIAAPLAQEGFFLTDVEQIQAALLEQPWIADAAVRREWPDVLNITLVEETAVARWGEQSLLNGRGQVFTPRQVPALPALPRLDGPQGSSVQVLARYREISEQLQPLGLKVSALSLDERRSWQLALANGIQLALGKEHAGARIRRFARVYAQLLESGGGRAIAGVDLRYANGFVVRWRDVGSDDNNKAHMS